MLKVPIQTIISDVLISELRFDTYCIVKKITFDFPRSEASVVVKGKIGSIISDQSWVRPFLAVVGDFLKGLTVRCQRLFFHTESFRLIHPTFIQTLVFTDF